MYQEYNNSNIGYCRCDSLQELAEAKPHYKSGRRNNCRDNHRGRSWWGAARNWDGVNRLLHSGWPEGAERVQEFARQIEGQD